ncbi:MAG: hypothetical protein QM503_13540 [Bacteroidota bacterium]
MKKLKEKFAFAASGIAIFIALIFLVLGCGNPTNNSSRSNQESEDIDVVVVEEDVWLIDEHQINDIPVTSMAKPAANKTQSAKQQEAKEEDVEAAIDEAEEEAYEEEVYEIVTMDELAASLAEQEYIATHTVEVTEIAIPLEEKQTVVSYNKKGKEQSAIQVISDGDGEVEQIIFMHKKHKDIYDVQAGLSGKQVKRLRREMKHMIKKGKVFLYSDQSNIMYLMDAQDMAGDEITAADVESMKVQAIIWKDKKHHKKK